jgi:hypothetical protein
VNNVCQFARWPGCQLLKNEIFALAANIFKTANQRE